MIVVGDGSSEPDEVKMRRLYIRCVLDDGGAGLLHDANINQEEFCT
jgi:hypothetical protein